MKLILPENENENDKKCDEDITKPVNTKFQKNQNYDHHPKIHYNQAY